jgi:hypothetical protein
MKKLSAGLFLLFIVSFFNSEAKALDIASKFEGSWAYECNDAPSPYHEGTLLVAGKENETTVKVIFKNGQSISGKNVAVKDGKLSFDIYLEGIVVKTTLEQKGEILTGKANSPEGVMELVGKKKKE